MTDPKCILVVDDDEVIRQFNSLQLKHAGLKVIEADSFESAIECLHQNKIDLALLDYVLQGKSGLNILEHVRSNFPECPCIMISAYADKHSVIQALRLGAVDFLEKPVDDCRLLHVIQHWAEYVSVREKDVRLIDYEAMYQSMMENRNLYQRLVDFSPNIIYTFSNKRGGIFYSKQAAKILGYPLAYLYNHPFLWFDSIHPDDKKLVENSISNKKPYRAFTIEYRILNAAGEWLWFRDRSISQRQEGAEILIDGAVEDITERKQVEQELKRMDTLLSESQRIAHIGSWQLLGGNDSLLWTPETFRILGIPPDGAPTMKDLETYFHPEDKQRVQDWVANCLAGNKATAPLEFRFMRPDGEIRYLLAHGDLSETKGDFPQRMIGTVQDITERKRVEAELSIAAATFESHEPIIITDANVNIIRVNGAFTRVTGYSQEEVLGKNPRIMSSGKHDKDFYTEMWRNLHEDGAWSGEIYDKRKNGDVYPKLMTITAITNAQNAITHYVAIFRDISQRKQLEEEIQNLAFYDQLTGLANRRLLFDRLNKAMISSSRQNDYGAILFIDLDNFKPLNDTLGHDYGDLLLKEVAERILSCVRETDTVSRYGGDEFVVLLEAVDTDKEQAITKVSLIAEKIRKCLATPYRLINHDHDCSPSIGICMFYGNLAKAEDLIECADKAMYEAKQAGRNTVRQSLAFCGARKEVEKPPQ